MKKLFAITLILALTMGIIAGCGNNPGPSSSTTSGSTTTSTTPPTDSNVSAPPSASPGESESPAAIPNVLDEREILLVIMRNLWTDYQGVAIGNVVENVISPNFNIRVDFMTLDGSTAENVIAGTENAVAMGADIIISGIADGLEQSCRIAQQAGAAFGLAYVVPPPGENDRLLQFDNWLGTVVNSVDGFTNGYNAGKAIIEDGHDNFAIVSFTRGLLSSADLRVDGFLQAVNEAGRNVVFELYEMPGPGVTVAVSTMLQSFGDEIGYIFAQAGGLNFVGPALTQSGMSIPVYSPNLPNDYETFFAEGFLDYINTFNNSIFALHIALGINYLNGTPLPRMPDNRFHEVCDVILRNAEQTRDFEARAYGPTSYTFSADELKSIIVAYNPDATYDDFVSISSRVDYQGIRERLG